MKNTTSPSIDPAYNPVMSYVLQNIDGISTVSKYMQKEIYEKFARNKSVKVIYNPIDTERFQHIEVKECDFRKIYGKYLIHVSNFRPIKNAPFIVEAFAEIQKKYDDVGLIMVGEGPERKECEDLARKLGISQHVLFQGVRMSLSPIYSCSSAVIGASANESFGLTLAEAMACETPVISSNVGGISEVVEHGKTGFLYEHGDKMKLVEYAIQLLEDRELERKLGIEGRKQVIERFNGSKIADDYLQWYESLIKK